MPPDLAAGRARNASGADQRDVIRPEQERIVATGADAPREISARVVVPQLCFHHHDDLFAFVGIEPERGDAAS